MARLPLRPPPACPIRSSSCWYARNRSRSCSVTGSRAGTIRWPRMNRAFTGSTAARASSRATSVVCRSGWMLGTLNRTRISR